MSDTDTRSVAEIIGWTAVRITENGKTRFKGWARGDGTYRDNLTPDDMLAWLLDRCDGVPEIHWAHDEWWFMGTGQAETNAPTLHAALEAAVRAVDNERTTE